MTDALTQEEFMAKHDFYMDKIKNEGAHVKVNINGEIYFVVPLDWVKNIDPSYNPLPFLPHELLLRFWYSLC